MTQKIGIMVCRDGDQPLRPGSVRGYFCSTCKKEVMITPHGLARIHELWVLCTECGLAMYSRFQREGVKTQEELSPTALAQVIEVLAGRN